MGRRPTAARNPSFMKILFGDFSENLLIPPMYVKLHGGTLTNKFILRLTGSQDRWTVTTKQMKNNSLYINGGLKEFAQHYSLQSYDVLVFRHVQDSEFNVDMFDKSCCPKQFVASDDISMSSREENPKTPASSPETVEELMARSEFPTFYRVMQSAYVSSGAYMPLPPEFVKIYMNDSTRQVKIDISNKIWTVGALKDGCGLRLSSSWGMLAKANALQIGDTCVFQLINTADYTFTLSIFRKTKKKCVKKRKCKVKSPSSPPRATVESMANSAKAVKAAQMYSSLSKYPSSAFRMKSAYREGGYLHISSTLIKKMKAKAGAKNAKLQCKGKKWDVVINIDSASCKIKKGWAAFVKANSITMSDAGVLELINAKDVLIRLSIFGSENIHPQ